MRKWLARNFPTLDGPKLMMLPILFAIIFALTAAIMQPLVEPGSVFSEQLWAE